LNLCIVGYYTDGWQPYMYLDNCSAAGAAVDEYAAVPARKDAGWSQFIFLWLGPLVWGPPKAGPTQCMENNWAEQVNFKIATSPSDSSNGVS
jgi:hypothetical protein